MSSGAYTLADVEQPTKGKFSPADVDKDPTMGPAPSYEYLKNIPGAYALHYIVNKLKEAQDLTQAGKEQSPVAAKLGEISNNLQGLLFGTSHGESAIGAGETGILSNPITGSLLPGAGGEPAIAGAARGVGA